MAEEQKGFSDMTPTPSTSLLPCPFCGTASHLELGNMWEERFKFTCTNCKAVGPVYRTLPEAIAAWNSRPITEEVSRGQKERSAEELRDSFTFSKPCCVDGEPDAQTVWLKIGVQSFCIDGYQSTKDEADWMRLMIGKALHSLLSAALEQPKEG